MQYADYITLHFATVERKEQKAWSVNPFGNHFKKSEPKIKHPVFLIAIIVLALLSSM